MARQLELFRQIDPVVDLDDTLSIARKRLYENLDVGVVCPCCGQWAMRYNRRLNSGSARWLIELVKLSGKSREWVHTSEVVKRFGGHWSDASTLLNLWGFMESKRIDPEDTSKRCSGYWRPTDLGIEFVECRCKVKSNVVVYNGVAEDFCGENVNIIGVLGKRFDYRELMGGFLTEEVSWIR